MFKKISLFLVSIFSIFLMFSCDKQYNVIYTAKDGGIIVGASVQNVEHGGTATSVTAIANDGYFFVRWSDDLTDPTRNDVNIDNNIEVTAEFAPKTYNVKYLAGTGGALSGDAIQNVKHGGTATSVTAIADIGYKFSGWSNGCKSPELIVAPKDDMVITAFFVQEELNLPILSIITEDSTPIDTKENYVACTVSVTNADPDHEFSSAEGKIKLRGNSTAYLPKSPYKLKFDKKVDLFGNGSAKTWTIIANYVDCSLIRNYIAYSLGSEFDNLNYTTTFKAADVYVNGVYSGVYLICEQIESGSSRVDIDEDYTNPDTGYLIELDDRAPEEGIEGIDYFNVDTNNTHDFAYDGKTMSYAIKSPDTEDEDFTTEHVAHIKNYVEQCMSALDSNDFNAVMDLIDVYSFVDGYIIDELMHCADIGISSFYMHKDKGGKICRGPLWDYDLSTGNYSNYDAVVNPNYLWAKSANIWYNKLLAHEEFVSLVANRLSELEETITKTLADCYSFAMNHKEAFERNFDRWEILGIQSNAFTPVTIYTIKTWEGHVDYLMNWLSLSLQNLKNVYPIV